MDDNPVRKKQRTILSFFSGKNESSNDCKDAVMTSNAETSERKDSADILSLQTDSQCIGLCCDWARKKPDTNFSEQDITRTKKSYGTQTRSFSTKWVEDYPWLNLCRSRCKVLCFTCCKAQSLKLITFSKCGEDAFMSVGFDNWKKALEKFKKHSTSSIHLEACQKLMNYQGSKSVLTMINTNHDKQRDEHYGCLLKVISTLKTMTRQGFPIRRREDCEGNLNHLLRMRSEDYPQLQNWLSDSKYMSHDVINELIELLARDVSLTVLERIRMRDFFAIMCDETRDISGTEQLTFCVRSVSERFEIEEDFIGLCALESTSAESIFNTIRDLLLRCGLEENKMRGQSYDGASVMAGRLNGVAQQFTGNVKEAIFVHCYAHRLNLVLQDVCNAVRLMTESSDLCKNLYNFINLAPKRLVQFKKIQVELIEADTDYGSEALKSLCPTRFTARTGAFQAVLNNIDALNKELSEIAENTSDLNHAKAEGLLEQLMSFRIYFGLRLSNAIYSAGEQVSRTLQAHDVDAQTVAAAISMFKSFLHGMRCEEEFNKLYESCVSEGVGKHGCSAPEESVPRTRKGPRRFDGNNQTAHAWESPVQYFRCQYFEVVDLAITVITRRFHEKSLEILIAIEKVIISAANGDVDDGASDLVKSFYDRDIRGDKFDAELRLFQSAKCTFNEIKKERITKVTSMSTVVEFFNQIHGARNMFPEIMKLVTIYLTIPLTTCTPERSFSSLRRIKTFSRSTMTQKRLNHCLILQYYRMITDNISCTKIAHQFITGKSETARVAYFGKR